MLGPDAARLVGLQHNPLAPVMHAAPLAGRAYNLLPRATGLLGNDATIARRVQTRSLRASHQRRLTRRACSPGMAVTESRATLKAAAIWRHDGPVFAQPLIRWAVFG